MHSNILGSRTSATPATTRRCINICADSTISLDSPITPSLRAQKIVVTLAVDEVTRILIEEWRAAHQRHSWAVCRYVIMPDRVDFLQARVSCSSLSEFIGAWKRWTSRKIHARWVGRGQRPRLQHCSNASSLLTFFAPMKVMTRNGITFSIIRFARGMVSTARNGNTPGRLKRLCCSRVADGGKFVIRFARSASQQPIRRAMLA